MESVEVSARTVDEAIDIALEELGLKRSQASIEILTPGKPGLFGLGGEHARVRVTALEEGTARALPDEEEQESFEGAYEGAIDVKDLDSDEVRGATEYLQTLLELVDINASVTVRAPETAADGLGRASAVLDVEGEDLGLLIGRRGTTLSALQYLVNVMVTRKLDSQSLVTIDVEHYHRRREETLRGLAQRMADRVRHSRRPITLEPMPPAERRILHLALKEDPYVTTASVGEGDARQVVIRPKGEARPEGRRPPGRGGGFPR